MKILQQLFSLVIVLCPSVPLVLSSFRLFGAASDILPFPFPCPSTVTVVSPSPGSPSPSPSLCFSRFYSYGFPFRSNYVARQHEASANDFFTRRVSKNSRILPSLVRFTLLLIHVDYVLTKPVLCISISDQADFSSGDVCQSLIAI